MANPYDAYDGQPGSFVLPSDRDDAAAAPVAGRPRGRTPNFFDQFDPPEPQSGSFVLPSDRAEARPSGRNPFDQFDPVEPRTASWTSIGANAAAGLNDTVTGLAALPGNALSGALSLIPGLGIRSGAGSRTVNAALEPLHMNPDRIEANTPIEHAARGLGAGVAGALLPEAAVAGLTRAGLATVAPRTAEVLGTALGRGDSAAASAANATIGGVGGATGALAEEAVPERYKGIANLAGNLVGGGAAAVGAAGVRAGAQAAASGFEKLALTQGARERIAGRALRDASDNPSATLSAIEDAPRELVPGSAPTTAQLGGDRGLQSLETTIGGAGSAQRAAEQETARTASLRAIQPGGAPEDLSAHLRSRLSDIDQHTDGILGQLRQEAQDSAASIGSGRAPEDLGAELRGHLVQAHDAARAREASLWEAVDPDGRLVADMAPVRQALDAAYGDLPAASAALLPPQESLLRSIVGGYREAEPLRQAADLRSNLATMMRAERSANGNSPALRRMSMLMDGVQQAITGQIERRAAADNAALAAGTMNPADTLAARLGGQPQGTTPQVGTTVYTPAGREVGVRYEVADASSLTGSHDLDLRPNPAFPPELQPRDRTRAASETQVASMAANLQPERLGASTSAMEGAPIVGPDGLVESGNARVLAVRRAYAMHPERAQAYRDFVSGQGYDTSGMEQPVLVRRRVSDLSPEDRVRFAQEANASPGLASSATERAAADAGRLSDQTLSLLLPGHDVVSASNVPFVRSFMKDALEKGEEGSFASKGRSISLEGAQRVRNALLHAAYGDSRLVGALAETGDENIRAFGTVMSDVAGPLAKLRRDISAGRIDPSADLSGPVLEAARLVQRARERGLKLSDAVAQQDAFSRISPEAEGLLREAYGPDLSRRLSRERLGTILQDAIAEAAQQTTDARLFGEPMTAEQILQGAQARNGTTGRSAPAQAQPAPQRDFGSRDRAGRDQARGLGSGPQGSADAGGSEGRILDRPALTPNIDAAGAERLKAAGAASRERARTFDQGPVGDVLDQQGAAGNYAVPNSGVPGRLFRGDASGGETARAYANAVGHDPAALSTFHQTAAEDLRRAAIQPDGTIDPRRFAAWQKRNTEALRALPEEQAQRFRDAASASQAVADAALVRRDLLDRYQDGIVGRLMKMDEGADVTRAVGAIFNRQDAVQSMRRLAIEARQSPEALDALRKAVADSVAQRFLSAEGEVRASIGTFVRDSRPVLNTLFSEKEIGSMQALADDITRGRAVQGGKGPIGSNGAAKAIVAHAASEGEPKPSLISALLVAGGAGKVASGIQGAVAGALGAGGKHILGALRDSGMSKTTELVREALLDPDLARTLMTKVSASPHVGAHVTLGTKLKRLSIYPAVQASGAQGRSDEDRAPYARGGAVMGFASGGGVPDHHGHGRELNTFSIVARCPQTGQLGIAVASAAPAVGTHCPLLRAGVGAVATQSLASSALAARILDALGAGKAPDAALAAALAVDGQPDLRQLGVVGMHGSGAAWTGPGCAQAAGHRIGPGYAIQGNMLASPGVIDAMVRVFETSVGLPLAERLMRALEAGEAAGGDKRGKQSAALQVVGKGHPPLSLRVDKHADPVAQLRRALSAGPGAQVAGGQGRARSGLSLSDEDREPYARGGAVSPHTRPMPRWQPPSGLTSRPDVTRELSIQSAPSIHDYGAVGMLT